MGSFGVPLYERSPMWLQERLIESRALVRNLVREGRRFSRELDEVRRSQWMTAEGLREYQFGRMAAVVRHASLHVPYYTELFREEDIDPGKFHSLEDFSRIPITGKGDVVAAGQAFLSRLNRGPRFKSATSGSTGLSLEGYRDFSSIIREHALLWRQLEWAGLRKGDRRAWMRGDMVVPLSRKKAPFWRMNRVDNMLMFSSFHLSEGSAREYIEVMERFDPVIIEAYPSSISFLARYLDLRGEGYRGRSIRGIVTSSETLLDDQRNLIEGVFPCRVFDWYGSYERVAAIGTCEYGRYHIISDYGYTELLPAEDEGQAEIVGTGFHNLLMPLLRYRTGDVVVPAAPGERCNCGRHFPVVKDVVGRIDDSIKTPDGRRIGMFAIIFDGLKHIWEVQTTQETSHDISIRVVPMAGFGVADEREIVARARQLVGPEMSIHVERVHDIPRTTGGKIRTVICRV